MIKTEAELGYPKIRFDVLTMIIGIVRHLRAVNLESKTKFRFYKVKSKSRISADKGM